MWRVSSGIFRGRCLKSPPKERARLTQEKVRKSIFDIIGARVEGANVLDLFCGSGSLGIEALSRGADRGTFIDKSHRCIQVVRENLTILGVTDKTQVICGDVSAVLHRFSTHEKYNLVLADPPYHTEMVKKILPKLNQYDILTSQVLLVIEHYKKLILPERIGGFICKRQESYGDTGISFYEKE